MNSGAMILECVQSLSQLFILAIDNDIEIPISYNDKKRIYLKGELLMGNVQNTFGLNNFKTIKENSKSVEFKHIVSEEVVYLLPNKEITIVLNPKTVEGKEDLEKKSHGLLHNTSFSQFPKRINTGKESISYGYAYKFQSDDELNTFLHELNNN